MKSHGTIHGGKVGLNGLWATYDTGLDFIGKGGLKQASTAAGAQEEGQRCLLWLGSSIGNFDRKAAAEFLAKTAQDSMRAGDTMLISIDRRNKPADVALAYNDPAGLTADFIMNGLDHADRALGGNVIDRRKFEYFDRYNAREGRHESYYRAKEAHEIRVPGLTEPIKIQQGELIHMEASYKFGERETSISSTMLAFASFSAGLTRPIDTIFGSLRNLASIFLTLQPTPTHSFQR